MSAGRDQRSVLAGKARAGQLRRARAGSGGRTGRRRVRGDGALESCRRRRCRPSFLRSTADPEPYIEAALQARREARLETRRSSALTDLRPELGKIGVPTLIIQGELD